MILNAHIGELPTGPARRPRGRNRGTCTRSGLTKTEQEILAMLAAGMSYKEIAVARVCSPGTVKSHAHQIYVRLGVGKKAEAIAKWRASSQPAGAVEPK